MNIPVIISCAVCLCIAILIDHKYEIPLGLTCSLSAFVICFLAFDMPASKVVSSYFPSSIVYALLLAMTYFSVFTENGTSQVIAQAILCVIKGNLKLYPWILYFFCSVLYIFFDGGALRYIITPLVLSVAKTGGGSTLMAVSTAYLSFAVGSLNPYIGIDASTRVGILTDMGLENAVGISTATWVNSLVMFTLLQGVIYLATRSWNIKNSTPSFNYKKAELTSAQKKSLFLLADTAILLILPLAAKSVFPCSLTSRLAALFNSYTVFTLNLLAVIFLDLGEWRNLLRHVSLKPIMMIIGITMLIKTAQEAGLQQLCVSAASLVPQWLIPPAFLLIGALLSLVAAAPTVQPMLFSIAASMASSPQQAILYISCVILGTTASGVSPLSNSGVAFLATVDRSEHDMYSKYMFLMAFVGPVVLALLSCTGIMTVLSGWFSDWYY